MKYLKKAWGLLDGIKTYLGGGGMMLSGAAMIAGEAAEIISANHSGDPLELIEPMSKFLMALPSHPGAIAFCAGLAAIGLGHKGDKAKVAIEKAASEVPKLNKKGKGKSGK